MISCVKDSLMLTYIRGKCQTLSRVCVYTKTKALQAYVMGEKKTPQDASMSEPTYGK